MPIIYKVLRKSDYVCMYVGSTIRTLQARMYQHKCFYSGCRSFTRYIYDNGGWNNYEFRIVTETTLINKDLRDLERKYIEELKPICNKNRPSITQEEHLNDIKENTKRYQSIKCDCECGGKYLKANKSIHLKTNKHQSWALLSKSMT